MLSDCDVKQISLLPASSNAIEIRRAPRNIPSRLADNLFWLSRYLERSENALRSIRMVLTTFIDRQVERDVSWFNALMNINNHLFNIPEGSIQVDLFDAKGGDAFIRSLIFDREKVYSIVRNLESMRILSWKVRDRISSDAWRILVQLEQITLNSEESHDLSLEDIHDLINKLLTCLAAFSGLEMESMTRAIGWRFLDMGRRIERVINSVKALKSVLLSERPSEVSQLQVLLEFFDCSMTHRSRYMDEIQLSTVFDLLVIDETNPRSVCFQFSQLAGHIDILPNSQNRSFRTLEQRIVLSVLNQICLIDMNDRKEFPAEPFIELLDFIDRETAALSDALSIAYFSHSVQHRLLNERTSEIIKGNS